MKRVKFRKMLLLISTTLSLLVWLAGLAGAAEIDDIRAAIKTKGAKWHADLTSIHKMSAQERKKRVGLIKPSQAQVSVTANMQAGTASLLSAPTGTFDWRSNGGTNYVTAVKDQGQCGSCWAFATTAALESYTLVHGTYNSGLNLSEQILVTYSGAGSCSGGYPGQASDFIRNTGLPPESYDPYKGTNASTALSGWQNVTDKIGCWQYVTTTAPDAATLKNALFTYGPLSTTMEVYSDFYAYQSGVYSHTTGSYEGAHAVLIVGYTDDSGYSGGGYFIVKNSWGTGWGESGFFRIAYSELKSLVQFGYYTIAYNTTSGPDSYSVSPTSNTMASSGGTGSISITAGSTSSWSALSNASWLSITSRASGTGSGTLTYSAAAGSATTSRTGTISILDGSSRVVGQFMLTQQPCVYSISATASSFTSSGGAGNVGVTAGSSGKWTATGNSPWLTIVSGATGSISGNIIYSVAANTTSTGRTGAITVKNETGTVFGTLSVYEQPSTFYLYCTGYIFTAAGGKGILGVSTVTGVWSVASNVPWITISSGASRTGSGTISYVVAANTSKSYRTGQVTVKDNAGKILGILVVMEGGATS